MQPKSLACARGTAGLGARILGGFLAGVAAGTAAAIAPSLLQWLDGLRLIAERGS